MNGFDGNGNTYSYKQLGNGSVIYQGTTFTLGQPTVPNAITNGAVYTLPAQGNYSNVYLIGAATTTGETSEPFILTYTTGEPGDADREHELMELIGRLRRRDDCRFHALREHVKRRRKPREPMISTDIKLPPIPPEPW